MATPWRSPPPPATARWRVRAAALWALSRRARNRLQHALNGNPRGGRRDPATAPRPQRAARLEPRQLQDLQLAATLRAAGWVLPGEVANDTAVRVYDTRLEPRWLRELALELAAGLLDDVMQDTANLRIVGGDFASPPHVLDADALQTQARREWGPDGPHLLVVPPRPHLEKWVQRVQLQAPLENSKSVIIMLAVVDRDRCPSTLDAAAVRRLLPQGAALFDDPTLAVDVVAVGERARLIRVPADDKKKLPPDVWDQAFLPRSKVLVALRVRRAGATRPPLSGTWIRGTLPDPEPSGLELLRVEYTAPPATRQRQVEQAAKRALAAVAHEMGIAYGPAHRLQQVQATHGGLVAILAVPRDEAPRWLRGSGCGGLFVRPFWTSATSSTLDRAKFNLVWLRGRRDDAAAVWARLHTLEGFAGLLASDKDVAVRVAGGPERTGLAAEVRLLLDDPKAKVHQRVTGATWWRFGPLEDADVFRLSQLLEKLGLVSLQTRLAPAGPFRRTAYFMAVGPPQKWSLDDGAWGGGCSARLTPASPPPRPAARGSPPARAPSRPGPSAARPAQQRGSGSPAPRAPSRGGLPATSTWGGPCASPSALPASQFPPLDRPPASQPPVVDPVSSAPESRRSRRSRRCGESPHQPGARSPAPPPSDALALLAAELREVRLELAQLRKELAAARLENDQLRLQLRKEKPPASRPAPARPSQPQPSASSNAAAATTSPPLSPVRPYSEPGLPTFDLEEQDERMAEVHLGLHPRDPQASPEGRKQARRALSVGPGPHDL